MQVSEYSGKKTKVGEMERRRNGGKGNGGSGSGAERKRGGVEAKMGGNGGVRKKELC